MKLPFGNTTDDYQGKMILGRLPYYKFETKKSTSLRENITDLK